MEDMNWRDNDDDPDEDVGDYERYGPDQITSNDIQHMESEFEDDDNRFAGLNSQGNDIFGRYGW